MKVDDVRTILRALNDANVRYLIVGGLAVVAHGYVRFTQDIDLVVQLPFVFEEEFERAKRHNWGDLQAPVLRIETLIVMKQATGRPQDLADAALLRDISEQQRDAE
jgi:predicted nucleotidyltransferase